MARLIHLVSALCLIHYGVAAKTYTGCHDHDGVQYCYGTDEKETPLLTYSSGSTAAFNSQTAATPLATSTITSAAAQTTAVTACHNHETEIFCINGKSEEVMISGGATTTREPPAQYTGCHSHEDESFCLDPNGEEVRVIGESGDHEVEDHDHGHEEDESRGAAGVSCHFHAGVEHCLSPGQSESSNSPNCGLRERDYNVPLRLGTLFVILVTSTIGVFAPMFLQKLLSVRIGSIVFTLIKQFGTGVIVAAALVHLLTHAELMFSNECLTKITYEATATVIAMAGIFISFVIEHTGQRIVMARASKQSMNPGGEMAPRASDESPTKDMTTTMTESRTLANLGHDHYPQLVNSKFSVFVMEAGIIFHSILIGLTLVVAGDSFYLTLLVVIVFHQFFEGLALGSRIALLPSSTAAFFPTKFFLALAFALITPLGMAIGIGVLRSFNGNNSATVIAIGTLDAISAGILLWVGLVDMWAADWVFANGDMLRASTSRTLAGGSALVAGMALMALLGKWA